MCCRTLLCLLAQLLKSPNIQERVRALGIDLDDLRRCLKERGDDPCQPDRPPVIATNPGGLSHTLSSAPELSQLISALTAGGFEQMDLVQAATTTPVKRRPKMEVSNENMFVVPKDDNGGKKAPKKK